MSEPFAHHSRSKISANFRLSETNAVQLASLYKEILSANAYSCTILQDEIYHIPSDNQVWRGNCLSTHHIYHHQDEASWILPPLHRLDNYAAVIGGRLKRSYPTLAFDYNTGFADTELNKCIGNGLCTVL